MVKVVGVLCLEVRGDPNVVYAYLQSSVAFCGHCVALISCQNKLAFMCFSQKISRQHLK